MESGCEAKRGNVPGPERRNRVPQPNLVLLLDWVRVEANPNACAPNGDARVSSNCDSHLDAHVGGHGHGYAFFHRHLDSYLSGYRHGQALTLTEKPQHPNQPPSRPSQQHPPIGARGILHRALRNQIIYL